MFSVTAFAFLGAPRRRTARLEPGAGCWTHSASHTGHTHVCMVVSFRRYTSAPSRGLARERVVRGGEVRGAQKALVRVHATKRRVVLGETSSDCRGAQVALRARRTALPSCRGTRARGPGPRRDRGEPPSQEEGGGRRKHSVRSFARARAGRTSSSADDTIARIRAPAHRARRAGGRMVTCASACATPRAPRRATPRVKLGRPPRGVFRALYRKCFHPRFYGRRKNTTDTGTYELLRVPIRSLNRSPCALPLIPLASFLEVRALRACASSHASSFESAASAPTSTKSPPPSRRRRRQSPEARASLGLRRRRLRLGLRRGRLARSENAAAERGPDAARAGARERVGVEPGPAATVASWRFFRFSRFRSSGPPSRAPRSPFERTSDSSEASSPLPWSDSSWVIAAATSASIAARAPRRFPQAQPASTRRRANSARAASPRAPARLRFRSSSIARSTSRSVALSRVAPRRGIVVVGPADLARVRRRRGGAHPDAPGTVRSRATRGSNCRVFSNLSPGGAVFALSRRTFRTRT